MKLRSLVAAVLVVGVVLAGAWFMMGKKRPAAPAASPARVLGSVPAFALESERDETLGRDDLLGSVWVADFIFTRCAGTCPMITRAMADLARATAARSDLASVRFVSISVDPDHDRPAVLREYGRQNGADPARWTFLTGTRESVRTLVRTGFKLPVEDQGNAEMPILHSQSFVLVDREGQIRGVYDALTAEGRAALDSDLSAVARETPRQRVLVPPDADKPAWLGPRGQQQVAAAASVAAPHDFAFHDRVGLSGITFRHRRSQDADKFPVHYDHGTAVATADVDGDGLQDLFFVNQVGPNALFRNLGGGRFEDITGGSAVAVGDRSCVAAAFADVDNDGDPDLFVTSVRQGNLLFRNDGKGHFTDATAGSGLDDSRGHASGAVFFDYDGDGLLDLFVTNVGRYTSDEKRDDGLYVGLKDAFAGHLHPDRSEPSHLYHNLGGGKFANVDEPSGLKHSAWSGDATAFDYDDDGRPDLYVLSMQGHDDVWHNVGGGRFAKTSREVFPATPWGSMGVKVLDWNGDGRLDVYVTDMHTDMSTLLAPEEEKRKHDPKTMFPANWLATDLNHVLGNALFLNLGGGKYAEVSDAANAETGWPWGVSAGDLNADGWPDLFVTGGMNYPFRYGTNSVLLNEGGKRFVDAEFVLGVEPRKRLLVPWYELDCGGADASHEQCKGRTGRIDVWGVRGTRSSVLLDVDGDGDLDVVTNEFGDTPQVLFSDLAEKRPPRFVTVRLVGKRSNRDGIGAVVTVVSGGRAQVQPNDGKSGYLAQSVMPLYFGLGEATAADSVRVRWPSGQTQTVAGPLPSGTAVVVTEAD
jgi:cytochrome oxidase Cu insertion factor (SCO1/SenC/PrrC family)